MNILNKNKSIIILTGLNILLILVLVIFLTKEDQQPVDNGDESVPVTTVEKMEQDDESQVIGNALEINETMAKGELVTRPITQSDMEDQEGKVFIDSRSEEMIRIPDQSEIDQAIQSISITDNNPEISGQPLNIRSSADKKPFTRLEGRDIGIPHMELLAMDDFVEPFLMGKGIASGDVNKDGYIDIVLAVKEGLQLYQNKSGKNFERVNLDIPDLNKLDTFVVALVDINNDGWLDLYLTSFITGNFYLLNREGRFLKNELVKLPASPEILTKAMSTGDVDRDGDLDIVQGNWLAGPGGITPPRNSMNNILINDNGSFVSHDFNEEITAETLSILLTDFNGDDKLDLIVGNDFKPPDYYYRGHGDSKFTMLTAADGIIPVSTNTTMSIDTGDYDNDLDLDIYITQVAAAGTGKATKVKHRSYPNYCDDLKDEEDRAECDYVIYQRYLIEFGPYAQHKPSKIQKCKAILFTTQRSDCETLNIYLAAALRKRKDYCQLIPEDNMDRKRQCEIRYTKNNNLEKKTYDNTIPIIMNENVMLQSDNDSFVNLAKQLNIETTGWSWNSKLADFDNDEWQDIYVVNGFWPRENGAHTKFFFHNQKGKSFIDRTDEFGLQNYMIQTAFTEVDIDNDGDLDVFANSLSGPIWFYRNNNQHNNAIEFEFNDRAGNYYGIGNKIIIHYGKNQSRHQLRELKAGGGFLSFNAPVVHFGLGEYEDINKIEVIWSTGEHTEIAGTLPANAKYVIARH